MFHCWLQFYVKLSNHQISRPTLDHCRKVKRIWTHQRVRVSQNGCGLVISILSLLYDGWSKSDLFQLLCHSSLICEDTRQLFWDWHKLILLSETLKWGSSSTFFIRKKKGLVNLGQILCTTAVQAGFQSFCNITLAKSPFGSTQNTTSGNQTVPMLPLCVAKLDGYINYMIIKIDIIYTFYIWNFLMVDIYY